MSDPPSDDLSLFMSKVKRGDTINFAMTGTPENPMLCVALERRDSPWTGPWVVTTAMDLSIETACEILKVFSASQERYPAHV